MAKAVLGMVALLAFFFLVVCSSRVVVGLGGGKVGGRTEIKDVKKNKEVQDLGRFSVEEFNRNQKKKDLALVFSEVVEAQKQVVSGIKYYLKIAAVQKGMPKTFDAVVVVKAWARSKELLTFAPSTN
ncbi:hypothetical protein HHK36_027160 [Tetracentron sinense]|uniref:Cystatin domain-containing protein n=1 Tax=Tetracentron sinense TaxID=13715 RepID=A0A835D2S6_TETSI|nr:hypothetical protein HHK36_027160 [Tetracentron sinense]